MSRAFALFYELAVHVVLMGTFLYSTGCGR